MTGHKTPGRSSAAPLCEKSRMTTTEKFTDGSSVSWVDKETLRYSDALHSALIWVDFEPGLFSKGRIIKASSINTWESCPEDESPDISDDARTRILGKATEYYERHNVKCRIER